MGLKQEAVEGGEGPQLSQLGVLTSDSAIGLYPIQNSIITMDTTTRTTAQIQVSLIQDLGEYRHQTVTTWVLSSDCVSGAAEVRLHVNVAVHTFGTTA